MTKSEAVGKFWCATIGPVGSKSKLGLSLPENLPWDDAAQIGRALNDSVEWSSWAIGDFLLYCDGTYSETRYHAAEGIFGVSYGVLRNIKSVCKAFPMSRRRDKPLRFKHHVEVASLSEKEQDRLLDVAAQKELSCEDLRQMIREKTEGKPEDEVRIVEPRLTAHTTPLCMWAAQQSPRDWPQEKRDWWKRELKPFADFYGQL